MLGREVLPCYAPPMSAHGSKKVIYAALVGNALISVIKFAAAGFRDFTRIAASDPVMWRDVFLTNRGAVLEMLGRLTEDLAAIQRAIRDGDGETLEALFTRTREIRRGVIDAGQHIPPVPRVTST